MVILPIIYLSIRLSAPGLSRATGRGWCISQHRDTRQRHKTLTGPSRKAYMLSTDRYQSQARHTLSGSLQPCRRVSTSGNTASCDDDHDNHDGREWLSWAAAVSPLLLRCLPTGSSHPPCPSVLGQVSIIPVELSVGLDPVNFHRLRGLPTTITTPPRSGNGLAMLYRQDANPWLLLRQYADTRSSSLM